MYYVDFPYSFHGGQFAPNGISPHIFPNVWYIAKHKCNGNIPLATKSTKTKWKVNAIGMQIQQGSFFPYEISDKNQHDRNVQKGHLCLVGHIYSSLVTAVY